MGMKPDELKKYKAKIKPIAKRMGVKYLAVFGSFARGEAKKKSDVDILVDFEKQVTFDGYFDIEFALEDVFERKVDLITREGLSKYVKPLIQKDLSVMYGVSR